MYTVFLNFITFIAFNPQFSKILYSRIIKYKLNVHNLIHIFVYFKDYIP